MVISANPSTLVTSSVHTSDVGSVHSTEERRLLTSDSHDAMLASSCLGCAATPAAGVRR
jgi:hypothetical protein